MPIIETRAGGVFDIKGRLASRREHRHDNPTAVSRRMRTYVNFMNLHFLQVDTNGETSDRETVHGNSTVSEIINNDGKMTFLVHSTKPQIAEDIMRVGLDVPEDYFDPERPDLNYTTLMLAGPDYKHQAIINTHLMAYRYSHPSNSVKVVIAFPEPNPKTWDKRDRSHFAHPVDPFKDTFLHNADGRYVILNPDREDRPSASGYYIDPPRNKVPKKYRILPQYVAGYFDLEAGIFVHNPSFFLNQKSE